jgi:hypothetical protein
MDQSAVKPLLIKEFRAHQIWIDIAKELLFFGEINKAKDLFKESYRHAEICGDKDQLSDILINLGSISYLEGEYL